MKTIIGICLLLYFTAEVKRRKKYQPLEIALLGGLFILGLGFIKF